VNPEYARFISLISLAAILCSSFATAIHAAPIQEPPIPFFAEPSLEVWPAWAWSVSSPLPPDTPSTPTISAASRPLGAFQTQDMGGSPLAPLAAGDILEAFTNTWSYSTIGLVYDPGRDRVRYAHESQSSSHRPTIYDVEYPVSHTVLFSVALSARNSGWPWQIDNRTGAGYDFVEDTYFLADYNGDLAYADDNIVEIDVNGTVINAWEMDDEVGSNDSADGSEIDSIIDIAVVPGNPTRYFATAAYDGSTVYEISLQKTGTWWTPNSWSTVSTYTVPGLTDNLGIDYDAENEVLYHSGWHATTIVVTDFSCNEITRFDCPGAGGYNSGITFIEGSNPPEIWVTDFSSDQTTRCEAPGGEAPPAPGWAKWINGVPWTESISVTVETSDTVEVVDVIMAVEPFTLTETWDPERLSLLGWDVSPPIGQAVLGTGTLDIVGPAGPPEVVTITKWFHVELCGWLTTTLREELVIEGDPVFFETRSFIVEKAPPDLQIDSFFAGEVFAGQIASFTLAYSNTGGYENDVWISNSFPISAPFIYAEPFPDLVGPGGLWTRWDVGDLATDARDAIVVYAYISETLPISTIVTIWDGIFDHMDVLRDETEIEYHIAETLLPVDWEKRLNGEPWHPGISVTLETSQTFVVEEVIDPLGNPSGFSLIEEWNPEELALLDSWYVEPITYSSYVFTTDGLWMLSVPPFVDYGPLAIFKEFHAEPCTWAETILWESLQVGSGGFQARPVLVNKRPPELWIDSFFDVSVYSGDEAQFMLNYGNAGGYDNHVEIRNVFPPEAPFGWSDPPPTVGEAGDLEVTWVLTEGLAMGQEGAITVIAAITNGLPPSTTIEIWDGIFNHANELMDETVIAYHVPPPTWDKWVNGQPWNLGFGVTVQTSDTITVTDVISTRSGLAMIEHWNPERLALVDYATEPEAGFILSETGSLSWEFPGGAPGAVTITKWFHVEPCTWTYTVLWEELWVEGVEWERRPVHIDKFPPDLRLASIGGGEVYAGWPTTFTLVYSNAGGYENDAWITNTFPVSAPFASASLTPTRVANDGTWAAWRLGGLETNEEGDIAVTVAITESLVASDTIEIWDGIFHDTDWLIADTFISYHVAQPPHIWTKWIAGEPWSEGITVTVETSDTAEVVDVISTAGLFELIENWDAGRLTLTDWAFDPPLPDGEWFTGTGSFVWRAPPAGLTRPQVVTLTKWFHVEPCVWTETILHEELVVQHLLVEERPVPIAKWAPELWLESEGGGDVYAGELATFTLIYSNTGGYENDVWIENEFPPEAPFVSSVPTPTERSPDGTWVRWNLGDLGNGVRGDVEVTIAISDALTPCTWITVTDWIYNHAGEPVDETAIKFHVACKELASVTLTCTNTGAIYTDTVIHFSADLAPDDATKPYTYQLTIDGLTSPARSISADPLLFTDTFPTTGTHTVEIAAWNCEMTSVVTDDLGFTVREQGACVGLTEVTIHGETSGYSGMYTFTTIYEPWDASEPISYTWDDDKAGDTSVRCLGVGTHTLMVTATNCTSALVTDVHEIVITAAPVCTEVTGVDLTITNTGAIYTDTMVHFGADIAPDDADKPYSYTIDYGDGISTTAASSADPLTALDHTFAATGTCDVVIEVWNCAMAAPVTDAVRVAVSEQGATCVDITGVDLSLVTAGDIYTDTVVRFSANILPDNADKPYSYTIDYGSGLGASALSSADPFGFTHTFPITGSYTVTFAAWNCAMTAPVSDSVSFTVYGYGGGHFIYLPLVMRSYP
jgi:hypothetical protein